MVVTVPTEQIFACMTAKFIGVIVVAQNSFNLHVYDTLHTWQSIDLHATNISYYANTHLNNCIVVGPLTFLNCARATYRKSHAVMPGYNSLVMYTADLRKSMLGCTCAHSHAVGGEGADYPVPTPSDLMFPV